MHPHDSHTLTGHRIPTHCPPSLPPGRYEVQWRPRGRAKPLIPGATCLAMPRTGPGGAAGAASQLLEAAALPCIVGCEGGSLLRCQVGMK